MLTSKPAARNTPSIGRLSGSTSAVNRLMPQLAADGGEVLEQHGGDAPAVVGVVDGEGDLGLVLLLPAVEAGHRHHLVAEHRHERHPVAEVDGGEPLDLLVGEAGLGREEAEVDALRRQPAVQGDEGVGVATAGSGARARCRRRSSTTSPSHRARSTALMRHARRLIGDDDWIEFRAGAPAPRGRRRARARQAGGHLRHRRAPRCRSSSTWPTTPARR